MTFWLSSAATDRLTIPSGTEVATLRTATEEAIDFTTTHDLAIIPCDVEHVASALAADGVVRDHDAARAGGQPFFCFADVPQADDALYVGLSEAVPRCAVTLRLDCQIEGIGVDPTDPPLVWEAWAGNEWRRCDVERDTTGGLNRAGDVVIHVPSTHEVSVIDSIRAGWIRARVLAAREGQPGYSASPRIAALSGFTSGGTAEAVNAETVTDEVIGVSEGVPGQRFQLQRAPVVPGQDVVLDVASGDGWQEWRAVDHVRRVRTPTTATSSSTRRRARSCSDRPSGSPTERCGRTARCHPRAPRCGSATTAPAAAGGRTSPPARSRCCARRSRPSTASSTGSRRVGGIDGEDLENAKVRGPIVLRTRNRAVTAEDYEQLAREAAPEIARVRALAVDDADDGAGGVRVLVVPSVADRGDGRLRFEQLVPDDHSLTRIAAELDQRRTIGARVVVEPPRVPGRHRRRPGAGAASVRGRRAP